MQVNDLVNAQNKMEAKALKRDGVKTELHKWCSIVANYSSIHGVNWYTFYNNSKAIRTAIFIGSMIIFILLPIFLTIEMVDFIKSNETYDSVEWRQNTTMKYPTITICSPLFFNKIKAEQKYGVTDELASYLIYVLNPSLMNIPLYMSQILDNTEYYQTTLGRLDKQLDSILEESGLNILEFMHDIALQCTDLIFGCEFHQQSFLSPNCCNTFFNPKPVFNLQGTCFSTRKDADMIEIYPASSNYFSAFIMLEESKRFNFPVELLGSLATESGSDIYFEVNHDHAPGFQLNRKPLKASYDTSSYVSFRVHETDRSALNQNFLVDEENRCVDRNELIAGLPYSRYNCEGHGLHFILPNCSFGVYIFQHLDNDTRTLRPCMPKDLFQDRENDFHELMMKFIQTSSKCKQPCHSREFIPTLISTAWDVNIVKNIWSSNNITVPNFTRMSRVQFFFETFEFEVQKIRQKTLLDFLSQVGGWTGLVMGASLLSFIEIFCLFGYLVYLLFLDTKEE